MTWIRISLFSLLVVMACTLLLGLMQTDALQVTIGLIGALGCVWAIRKYPKV